MAEITHEMLVATVEQCQADAQTLAGRLEVLEAQAVSVGHASAVRVALAKAFEAIANAEVAVTSIRQELTDGGHDDIAAQLAGREVAETEYYGGVRAA